MLPRNAIFIALTVLILLQAFMWFKDKHEPGQKPAYKEKAEQAQTAASHQEEKVGEPQAEAYSFMLTDQNGNQRSSEEWKGKHVLLFFGFSHCPSICPAGLAQITAALNMLGEDAHKIQPVFISVDVERDTPEQLKIYMENFHPSFVALTGKQEQIDAVTQAYGVVVRQMDTDMGMMYNHTADALLLDKEGEVVDYFPSNIGSNEMAEKLQTALKP